MGQVVTQQVGRSWEALFANFAVEEFLARVLEHMLTQAAAPCKALATVWALVGQGGA